MTKKTENTTEKGTDAKQAHADGSKAPMENCGCDCASMMAWFSQRHPNDGTADEKTAKKKCC